MHWLAEHWPHLIEIAGLPVTLIIFAITYSEEAKVRRVETIFHMNEAHRKLWMYFDENPDLAGILNEKRDVAVNPPTGKEVRFVNYLFHHLNGVFQASKAGISVTPEHLAEDVRSFFALPVPHEVWSRLKSSHERKFVWFVQRCLGNR